MEIWLYIAVKMFFRTFHFSIFISSFLRFFFPYFRLIGMASVRFYTRFISKFESNTLHLVLYLLYYYCKYINICNMNKIDEMFRMLLVLYPFSVLLCHFETFNPFAAIGDNSRQRKEWLHFFPWYLAQSHKLTNTIY